MGIPVVVYVQEGRRLLDDQRLTEFSGVSGRILQRTLSPGSLLTGILVGFVLFVGSWTFALAGAPGAAAPFSQIVIAFALARFAVNGHHGEWSGSILSSHGGSWFTVTQVALRYLSLTAIWMLPMILIGFQPASAGAGPPLLAVIGSAKALTVLLVYLLAVTLTPPLFLIVSTTAVDFSEIFSPAHWKQQLADRQVDLFAVYAVHAGGLGIAMVLLLVPIAIAFGVGVKAGLLVTGLALCLWMGMAVNLLGRLCGFFATGDVEPRPTLDDSSPEPPPIEPAGPTPMPTTQDVMDEPVFTAPIPVSNVEASARPPANSPIPVSIPIEPLGLEIFSDRADDGPRKPALLDAQQRVSDVIRCFPKDPARAISQLQDLVVRFEPSPHVLCWLAVCLHKVEQVETAIEAANRGLPLCFERGLAHLASEVFKELAPHSGELMLDHEQMLVVANTLTQIDDLAAAARAFSILLTADPDETLAVKGLLQVADRILEERGKPDAALKVYEFLIDRCPASPLADFMYEGRDQSRRMLAAVQHGRPV